MDIAHVQGYVSVRVNDDQLGVKFVRIQVSDFAYLLLASSTAA